MKRTSSRPAPLSRWGSLIGGGLISATVGVALVHADGGGKAMSPEAQVVANDHGAFGPDPHYGSTYAPTQQIEIYGGKHKVDEQRPIVEIGQPLYVEGPLTPTFNDVGRKNMVQPAFSMFGDWGTAIAYNNK